MNAGNWLKSGISIAVKLAEGAVPSNSIELASGDIPSERAGELIRGLSETPETAGAASGIMKAEDPVAMIDEMIAAVRRAADDLKKQGE